MDAVPRAEAAGSDIAIPWIRWIAMIEPDAPVIVGCTLGSTDSSRIAISTRKKAATVKIDRIHEHKDTVDAYHAKAREHADSC